MAKFFKPVDEMAIKKKPVISKTLPATKINKPSVPQYRKGYRVEGGAFQSMFGIGRR